MLFSRRSPIKRTKPLRAKRATRNGSRVKHGRVKPRMVDPTPEQERFWDSLPDWCQVPDCWAASVNHHLLARAPGKRGRRDHWFVVKLCPAHHNMGDCSVHLLGSEAAFERETGVDFVAIAVANRARWEAKNNAP